MDIGGSDEMSEEYKEKARCPLCGREAKLNVDGRDVWCPVCGRVPIPASSSVNCHFHPTTPAVGN